MSTTYVKITNAQGTVLTGNGGAAFASIDSSDFDQTLAATAAQAKAGNATASTISFPIQDSGLNTQILAVELTSAALSNVEFATYDDQGRLTGDYSFYGSPQGATAVTSTSNSFITSDQNSTFQFTAYQARITTYDANGTPTTTTTGKNLTTGVAVTGGAPATAPTTNARLITATANAHDAGGALTYQAQFSDTGSSHIMNASGGSWFAVPSGSFGAADLSTLGTSSGASRGPASAAPVNLTFGANALSATLFKDFVTQTSPGPQIEIAGFSSSGQLIQDNRFSNVFVSGYSVDLGPSGDNRNITFTYGQYATTQYRSAGTNSATANQTNQKASYDFVNRTTTTSTQSLAATTTATSAPAASTQSSNVTYYIRFADGTQATIQSADFSAVSNPMIAGQNGKPQLEFSSVDITLAPSDAVKSELAGLNTSNGFSVVENASYAANNDTTDSFTFNRITGQSSIINDDGTVTYSFDYDQIHEEFRGPGVPGSSAQDISYDRVSNVGADGPTCYCDNTLIRTTRGDVAVQCLVIGDRVVTASGQQRPIKWLGHRKMSCCNHPRPHEVMPVRIAAHAFDDSKPSRDLFVSPGHALCVDLLGEVLIPAAALVNGATIAQVDVDTVTYWHVELDSHDILIAENMPAESYLDMGNKAFFVETNVVSLAASTPDAPVKTHADFCRPFLAAGPIVDFVRARLRERAVAAGWSLAAASMSDMHVVADGTIVRPDMDRLSARFVLPADVSDVWLVSDAGVPSQLGVGADSRRLGLCLRGLSIDDGLAPLRKVAMDDACLTVGFHACEEGVRRWTAGRARLPATLWAGCRGQFFLRVDLESAPLPHWQGPVVQPAIVYSSKIVPLRVAK